MCRAWQPGRCLLTSTWRTCRSSPRRTWRSCLVLTWRGGRRGGRLVLPWRRQADQVVDKVLCTLSSLAASQAERFDKSLFYRLNSLSDCLGQNKQSNRWSTCELKNLDRQVLRMVVTLAHAAVGTGRDREGFRRCLG